VATESQVLYAPGAAKEAPRDAAAETPVTIEVVYGSQTGNAESVARRFQARASERGLVVNVTSLNDFGVDRLRDVDLIHIVCSTYNEGNEGDMPDNAVVFWRALAADDAPRLEGLRFSVLALGDEGYFDFCHAGQLIDERLEQLGAQRVADRMDCDMFFEDAAEGWTSEAIEVLAQDLPASAAHSSARSEHSPREEPVWDRRNPFEARLANRRTLSKDGSDKEVVHYEIDLEGSGITYTAGDSLAVQPINDPRLVDLLLQRFGLDGDTDADGVSLRDRLLRHWEIRTPSFELIEAIVSRDPSSALAAAGEDREQLQDLLYGRDVLDLLEASPSIAFTVAELSEVLRPLQARQFSIASSPQVKPNSVELTVASVRYGTHREHGGVATTYLADRVDVGGAVLVYPQPNAAFSVPDDDAAPIILVGPGTGIAPFRGFLQERQAREASGPTWLFFGDRHREVDFLYEEEIEAWLENGTLDRLDLAFSRDQGEKHYVQTRMTEQGADLFAWLENGAHFYVCGDAERMAKDVEDALLRIIAENGHLDADASKLYLENLILTKRYVRDVY
jgi:sulfite reductase (NADPH) flavoprotein alpha-component